MSNSLSVLRSICVFSINLYEDAIDCIPSADADGDPGDGGDGGSSLPTESFTNFSSNDNAASCRAECISGAYVKVKGFNSGISSVHSYFRTFINTYCISFNILVYIYIYTPLMMVIRSI